MIKPLPLIAAGLLLAACHKAPEPAPQPTVPVTQAAPNPPPDQLVLVKEMAGGDPKFCVGFQQTQGFDNWIVTVDDVETSTVNQSIDITFAAGEHVGLEEVVQTTDPLYKAITGLHVGHTVRISGRFSHGNGECSYRLDKVSIVLTAAST